MTHSKPIRILIADDHVIVREGLTSLIGLQEDMEIVGEAANGVEAVAMARDVEPDLVLMDMAMPRKDGLTAITEIKQSHPAIQVLVLTSFADDQRVFPAIKAGALGYLLKDTPRKQLLQAIVDVSEGRASLHPQIAIKMMGEINQPPEDLPPTEVPLTGREMDTLRLVAQGMSNQEISEQLDLSTHTVARHINNILGKLHLANRTQAALYALRQGIASLDADG